MSVVIDDIGYQRQHALAFFELDIPITFAMLPNTPHASELSRLAKLHGVQTIIHLPMEPKDSNAAETQALRVGMPDNQLIEVLDRARQQFPDAVGLNNHQGSYFTSQASALAPLLRWVQAQQLFVLDSRTDARSVFAEQATNFGIVSTSRDIFLDNERQKQSILQQLFKMRRLAQKQGRAIAIGHPYPETFAALQEFAEIVKKTSEGETWVPLSDVLFNCEIY